MAYADDSQGIKLKESSALFHEDSESWFQNLPHIGNVRPYGLAVARAKAQLLKDCMDGPDSLSNVLSPTGETDQNGGVADG